MIFRQNDRAEVIRRPRRRARWLAFALPLLVAAGVLVKLAGAR